MSAGLCRSVVDCAIPCPVGSVRVLDPRTSATAPLRIHHSKILPNGSQGRCEPTVRQSFLITQGERQGQKQKARRITNRCCMPGVTRASFQLPARGSADRSKTVRHIYSLPAGWIIQITSSRSEAHKKTEVRLGLLKSDAPWFVWRFFVMNLSGNSSRR